MTQKQIEQKIYQILTEKFGISESLITTEATLTAELNLSPIEISDLIALITNEFHLRIPEDVDIEQIKNVNDLNNFVEQYSDELEL